MVIFFFWAGATPESCATRWARNYDASAAAGRQSRAGNSPFRPGSAVKLPRRMTGLGTPVWRLMENLRPLNAMTTEGGLWYAYSSLE